MTAPKKLPQRYWHCRIVLSTGKRSVANDLTFKQLYEGIVEPWRANEPFEVHGLMVGERADAAEIQIVHTRYDAQAYHEEAQARWYAQHNLPGSAVAIDYRHLPFERKRGEDFTRRLLLAGLREATRTKDEPAAADVEFVLRLCRRLPEAARVLRNRYDNRPPHVLKDEYDAQNLLHAVISSVFEHSVVEEPLPKVAGVVHGRADLAIEKLGVLIELKYVRSAKDQARVVKEFAVDARLYSKWPHLKTFVYVVVNSGILKTPESLDELSEDAMTIGRRTFRAVVVRASLG